MIIKTIARIPNRIFGIQIASSGGAPPFMAKVLENSIKMIKLKEITKPIIM